MIDVTEPTDPQQVGSYDTLLGKGDLVVSGAVAYVVGYGTEMHMLDVSDPTTPRRIGGYSTTGNATGVAVHGSFAYLTVSTWNGNPAPSLGRLEVVDIGDPANPQRLSSYEFSGQPLGVAVSGRCAYVAAAGLQVIDVNEPTNLRPVGGSTSFDASAVSAQGENVYVGGAGLSIFHLLPELRIGPAIVLSDGRVQLQLNGASGQGVRVQRSANLVDWEDWRTVNLDGTGCELIDETATASHRFYRAVEDNSVAIK